MAAVAAAGTPTAQKETCAQRLGLDELRREAGLGEADLAGKQCYRHLPPGKEAQKVTPCFGRFGNLVAACEGGDGANKPTSSRCVSPAHRSDRVARSAPPAPRQSQAPSEPDFPDDLATHVVYDARPSSRPPPRSRVV